MYNLKIILPLSALVNGECVCLGWIGGDLGGDEHVSDGGEGGDGECCMHGGDWLGCEIGGGSGRFDGGVLWWKVHVSGRNTCGKRFLIRYFVTLGFLSTMGEMAVTNWLEKISFPALMRCRWSVWYNISLSRSLPSTHLLDSSIKLISGSHRHKDLTSSFIFRILVLLELTWRSRGKIAVTKRVFEDYAPSNSQRKI